MKRVTVRYFAAFREATGVTAESVETSAATLAGLFQERAHHHAGLSRYARSLVAVNQAMRPWEDGFEDGAEVLFFPPVGGG